jgi:hypothetical protein
MAAPVAPFVAETPLSHRGHSSAYRDRPVSIGIVQVSLSATVGVDLLTLPLLTIVNYH